jgi:hypothetical protein
MINAKPSINPADQDTLAGAFRHIFGKMMQGVDGMLPARVVSFNGDRNAPRVSVQPLIAMITTEGQRLSRATIASLPVFQIGGGGHLISFNIKAGDLGWIIASDRDISTFLQTYSESQTNTKRRKKFSDALFIPDVMRNYAIASEDNENAVFQSLDGTVKIALWADYVKITAPHLGLNANPVTGAAFQIDSTDKAFIPPRMTTAQRNAIPSPIEGMVVWNTTTHALSTYNGTVWS